MEIKRIYVEKKQGFNIEAEHILADLKGNLNMENIQSLRIVNCYDIEGMKDTDFEICKNAVFAEPPVDIVYEEVLAYDNNIDFVFGVKYLPGQYDQRADSAMQCIQVVTKKEPPIVETSKVYIITGELTHKDKQKIKSYCVNPVDSMEASLEKPQSLVMKMNIPDDIVYLDGFIDKKDEDIRAMQQDLGLAMSSEDLIFCRDYFKNTEKRNPSVTEIRVIDTYWSDHCRHTTFLTSIQNIRFEDGPYKAIIEKAFELYLQERKKIYIDKEKDLCLMDIAVMGMKALRKKGLLEDLDESEEINACSIIVNVDVDGKDEEWLIMFKNETHNHPTEIEPFGGAATCLGGAIRDPLSGRSYVYQAMRVTGSGNVLTPVKDTVPGKLPQRKISIGAAHGYSSYGNQIGLATGLVNEIYDDGYVAKRMEIGAVIGAAKKENVVRERPKAGDVIILAGGRTGRDGCGGATGSSKEHDEKSILNCGAEVQKGNPPTERKLQRLFRNPNAAKLIKRCNDFGAGGVSVAIGELAEGLDIHLDAVPKKYEGLDGTELAISESQERMAVVVDKNDVDAFLTLALEENLEAVPVAYVTDNRRLRMIWRDKDIVNISRDFLDTNGAKQYSDVQVAGVDRINTKHKRTSQDSAQAWFENLRQMNVASQKGLVERFDSTIGSGTVLMPFGGKYQLTPSEVMAAKIPVGNAETTTVSLMSYGFNPELSKQSPFHGAVFAVVESVAKLVAAGADYKNIRLTFQEYFERLNNDPLRWGKPFSALLGAFYAQMQMCIPSIGGKDSMSGTFKDMDVPPTLVSFAVHVTKESEIISNEFKKPGSLIVEINTPYDADDLPDFERLMQHFESIRKLISGKKVLSANAIGFGGIAAVLSKMSFGNRLGFEIEYSATEQLYNEKYGSFILELDCARDEAEELLAGLNSRILGQTLNEPMFKIIGSFCVSAEESLKAWLSPLEKVFPTGIYAGSKESAGISIQPYTSKSVIQVRCKTPKPRVFIPVFPGTNCEYDTARQFELAGAESEVFVFKNLNSNLLEQSVQAMVKKIGQSQIIAMPGGFSAGDEPEGSGKFIAAVFRNPYLKEAVTELLNKRDGLILGICNGFQALVKLGLLPYGEIRDMEADSPTLTFNTIGRHISNLTKTKIVSKLSPWFNSVEAGDIHTIVVSHGEGRFVAQESMIQSLAATGQIATQYVDFDCCPTYDIIHNPNGSTYAIESITSPDGRILGKMGHSERIGNGLYKNVPGNKDQKLFESGVNYFR